MKIKSRIILNKKEKKKVIDSIQSIFGSILENYSSLKFEEVKTDCFKIIYIDNKQILVELDEKDIFFTLKGALLIQPQKRRIFVDKNAVKYIVNGANIMIPGITNVDPDIGIGDYVVVLDDIHKKPIAIGRALLSSETINNSKNGKAVQSLFHVGDELWNL